VTKAAGASGPWPHAFYKPCFPARPLLRPRTALRKPQGLVSAHLPHCQRFRRMSLSEPTTDAQPKRREPLKVPQSGPDRAFDSSIFNRSLVRFRLWAWRPKLGQSNEAADFIALAGGALAARPLAGSAQQPEMLSRIAVAIPTGNADQIVRGDGLGVWPGFLSELRRLG
jgi:hypothetical protein